MPGTTTAVVDGTVGGGNESLTQQLVKDFFGVLGAVITSQGPQDAVYCQYTSIIYFLYIYLYMAAQ